MKNLETRKYQLIWLIMQLENEALLTQMEHLAAQNGVSEDLPAPYMRAVKPLRKGLTLEQLKQEKGYKPLDKVTFFQQADSLQIKEPIASLLAMLTP